LKASRKKQPWKQLVFFDICIQWLHSNQSDLVRWVTVMCCGVCDLSRQQACVPPAPVCANISAVFTVVVYIRILHYSTILMVGPHSTHLRIRQKHTIVPCRVLAFNIHYLYTVLSQSCFQLCNCLRCVAHSEGHLRVVPIVSHRTTIAVHA
jgi:hypothetical protein